MDTKQKMPLEENQIYSIVHPGSTKGNIRYWDGQSDWSLDLKGSFRTKDKYLLKETFEKVKISHIAVPVIITVRKEKIVDSSGEIKWQVITDLKSIELEDL